MENTELQAIWQSYDSKIEDMLSLNKKIALDLARQKIHRNIGSLYRPKGMALVLGVPYTLLLFAVAATALMGQAYLVAAGFGAIALLMTGLLLVYGHQLYLIGQVRKSEAVLSIQRQLSRLRLAGFRSLSLAIFQLPFWSICWMSVDALQKSPWLYGGVHLAVFLALSGLAYWLHQKVSHPNKPSRIRDFFLTGNEWEPIRKSAEILEQIGEYGK